MLWHKSPYPYIVAIVLTVAVLYILGRSNPAMMLACVLVASLYFLVVQVMVLICAFKDGIGQGFLTLCVPFYGLYYVFKVNGSPTLQALYSVAVGLNLLLRFIPDSALALKP